MLEGHSNSKIAVKSKRPLSTIQRRTRKIVEGGYVEITARLNYKKFGYKKGLLHVYLTDGNASLIGEKISKLSNILSVSIHIGNSDVVAEYVCKNAEELLQIMAAVKHFDGVEKVVWSEEVYTIPLEKKNVAVFPR